MPLDFPSSPTNGQYYNGFVYNAANETWDSAYAPRAATIPISSPNYIINGAFDIWQRGTGATVNSGIYSNADRWMSGSNSTTITRETDVPTNVSQYSLKIVASSANSIIQRIEAANIAHLAGQTVTFSFYYKRTAGSGNVDARFYYPSATDNFATVTQIGSTAVLASSPSSSWTRYSTTLTLPADVNKGLQVLINNDGNTTSFIAGVQLEAGAAATDFRRNAPSLQAELAACQRYYYRRVAESSVGVMCHAVGGSTTSAVAILHFPVNMRIAPPSVEYNPTLYLNSYFSTNGAISSISLNTTNTNTTGTCLDITGTTITADKPYKLTGNGSSTAYLGFSAEL